MLPSTMRYYSAYPITLEAPISVSNAFPILLQICSLAHNKVYFYIGLGGRANGIHG